MKKSAQIDANTAVRAGCSKAGGAKNFAPSPLSRGAGRPKFNQLEMVTTFTYKVQTQFGEDRCTQFRVIVVTDPQTHTRTQTHAARPPQTGPITIHCAAKLSAQCKKMRYAKKNY